MNNDDLRDRARIVALTAIVNLMIPHLGRTAIDDIANGLIDEIHRISDGDEALNAHAAQYIDKAMTSLKTA